MVKAGASNVILPDFISPAHLTAPGEPMLCLGNQKRRINRVPARINHVKGPAPYQTEPMTGTGNEGHRPQGPHESENS